MQPCILLSIVVGKKGRRGAPPLELGIQRVRGSGHCHTGDRMNAVILKHNKRGPAIQSLTGHGDPALGRPGPYM